MADTTENAAAHAADAAQQLDHAAAAGHGDTGAEVLHVAEVAMPQLDTAIFPNLIFWLVVALVALYLILTRVALPRIGTILAERNDAISNDLEMAALYKRRAEEAETAYNAALAKARDEAQKIAAETKAEVGRELGAVMAKADAEIAAKAAESESRIREIEASATQSVGEVARAAAADIVAAIGPRPAKDAAIAKAVEAAMKG
ncbi:F0F1 ATP synthase subunit B' [Amaricoccus sp.]|uniref:F0F1 ATP synthase subunit B' n=1 Tax=Amaricoccus sp. TaxID=1872485 RepID=UPI001B6D03A9|nr:F0F1 ATP synthase subunit B' [Amaricoccus sp.]MBP7240577.1 F0F1 ATP synthase subunit B' [Amaricoccus sp.]